MSNLIKILIFANEININEIRSPQIEYPHYERNYEIQHHRTDEHIKSVLSGFEPNVIVSIGKYDIPDTHEIEKRHIRLEPSESGYIDYNFLNERIINKYIELLDKDKEPLFSITTPLYKSDLFKLSRLYNSLKHQTYQNWEWIVYDDSPFGYNECYDFIQELTKFDYRIQLFRKHKNSGIIGEVKRNANMLTSGKYLVEVDHDDKLVNTCLENLKIGYQLYPESGFVYGYACEMKEDYSNIIDYGNDWAFGYGSYRDISYNGINYKTAVSPNINPKTVRHIVSAPNHVRSWSKDLYCDIGGHNKYLHVADDYELFVRTFLNTRITKIDTLTYIQYFCDTNTQWTRNGEIQRLVYYISKKYDKDIHNRLIQLGIDDYIWEDHNQRHNMWMNSPHVEQFANYIVPKNLLR